MRRKGVRRERLRCRFRFKKNEGEERGLNDVQGYIRTDVSLNRHNCISERCNSRWDEYGGMNAQAEPARDRANEVEPRPNLV